MDQNLPKPIDENKPIIACSGIRPITRRDILRHDVMEATLEDIAQMNWIERLFNSKKLAKTALNYRKFPETKCSG